MCKMDESDVEKTEYIKMEFSLNLGNTLKGSKFSRYIITFIDLTPKEIFKN
jgi:hypothetical protein